MEMEYDEDCASDYEVDEYDSGNEDEMEEMPNEDEYFHKVLSSEEIVTDMLKKISSVQTILEIPATTTRILLHHFKWDEEKLLEKFYSGDKAALFSDAHIIDPSVNIIKKSTQASEEDCEICMVPLPRDSLTGLECNHRFCGDCWDEYLSLKVMGEGECLTISCPAHKCDILVDDATATALIKDSKVKSKYQFLITQSFVEYNRLLKWCPTPDCNHAVKVSYIDHKPVTCNCGTTFCFKCNEKWHAPISCDYLGKWLRKINEDDATAAWLKLNTKECPQCKSIIEKDGGCNHIHCKKCKFHFCWVCNGEWNDHSNFYGCSKYPSDEVLAGIEASQVHMKRFLFFSERYGNHVNSIRLQSNLYTNVEERIQKMQTKEISWAELQFLKSAVNVLGQCRQVLMYTYAFAYFLEKCHQSTIFEDNQQDLEKAVESLSHYLEKDIDTEKFENIKQKVQSQSAYCQQRRKVLLDHVNDGYENDWWTHIN